jgi:uncharacterized membrane protein YcaP (DUF421 family)
VGDTVLFYDGWEPIVRTAIVTPLAYAGLVLALRVAGKRTLAQLNVFDWVVTVALGSALATVVVSTDVALAQGMLAIAGLIALQFAVSFVTSRWERARHVVTAEPMLLVRDGEMLREAMRRERVAESELLQALRESGHPRVEGVAAVVLETNGAFTVLTEAAPDAPAIAQPRSPA